MFNSIGKAAAAACFTVLLAAGAFAQTSGTVTINGTVSKYVEITSGGGVTLTGNSTGGVTTDGTANSPLAVVLDFGELGPSNENTFVKATVPLKIRSNAAYELGVLASVTSTGTSSDKIAAADIGFGLGTASRTGTGVASGTDTNATGGDPTLAANGQLNATSGRFEFKGTLGNLGAFGSNTVVLSGPRVMNAVPRANTNGLTVPAYFAVKPQFYEVGTVSATVTFTVTAP